MGGGEDPTADVETVELSGRYGSRIREEHDDAEYVDSWPVGRTIPDYFSFLLGKSRVRIDRSLRRTRVWRLRTEKFAAHLYRKWIIEALLRQKAPYPSADGRHIPLNAGAVRNNPLVDERTGKHYVSNSIRSNRYTLLSFLPKQLFFQFRRLANFYFLLIGVLQQVPGWSPTGRFTTIIPLFAFIALIMAKEGWDDWHRYLLDRDDNLALVVVLKSGGAADAEPMAKTRRLFDLRLPKELIPWSEKKIAAAPQVEMDGETQWVAIRWRDVRVGDIIRLERNERVPADIALLHATGPNSVAYIDTMALDGETTLKVRQPSALLADRCDTISKLEKCKAEFVCEDPNANLYKFEGRIVIDGETMPLGNDEVVLRGSTIRNTKETIGVVINTGEECKIRMNASQYMHAKSPKINRFTNSIVICVFIILIAIAAGISGGYVLWQRQYEKHNPFLSFVPVSAPSIIFGTVILINALIPLSLYIVIELVKIVQALQMNDLEMYDAETDTPISINTNTILEDLGQVNYIFSDKTGTLTENKMQFRKLTVGGTSWLHTINIGQKGEDEQAYGGGEKATKVSDADSSSPTSEKGVLGAVRLPPLHIATGTEKMLEYINRSPNTAFSLQARQFLLCIALCHTCLPETSSDGKITFQAASPDEVALVQAAQDMGYLLVNRPTQSIQLQIPDESGEPVTETYTVLKVIEFSSSRKRMSIIVRIPDGRICVICKGADDVIMSRLRLSELATITAGEVDRKARERYSLEAEQAIRQRDSITSRSSYGRRSGHFRPHSARTSRDTRKSNRASRGEEDTPAFLNDEIRPWSDDRNEVDGVIDESIAANDAKVFENCFRHIEEYATEGLRILLYGYRYISDQEYEAWNTLFQMATTSLVDRQEQIEKVADMLEKNFELAGATAIEDKLQAGVPETVDKLARANIKTWMLTGDKRETAMNIARAANLAKSFSQTYVLDVMVADPEETMRGIFLDIEKEMVLHSVLVLDGHTLETVQADKLLNNLLFELAVRVDSVICCRASPSQKATLVTGVREAEPSCVTLAIGDGANDIAMIQASHVGIGISGREGRQAARVADYSIAQFRFLQRLLLVHGHWLYVRTSKYILCTFWKEWVFYIAQAQYQRLNGYSGTSLYQSWTLIAYNISFTSLPIFFYGICEQDLSPETLLAVPELYAYGQRDQGINLMKCIAWLFMGTVDTILVITIVWAEFNFNFQPIPAVRHYSHDNSIFPMGSLTMTIIIVLINVKILVLEMHNKTWVPLTACAVSLAIWFFFLLVIGSFSPDSSSDTAYRIYRGFSNEFGNTVAWWSVAIGGIFATVGLHLGLMGVLRVFFPTDRNLWQEVEKVEKVAAKGGDEDDGNIITPGRRQGGRESG